MLELWGMWSNSLFPSFPSPLWPGVVAPDRLLLIDKIKLNCVRILNWVVWKRTVYMQKKKKKKDLALKSYNGWCAIKPNQTIIPCFTEIMKWPLLWFETNIYIYIYISKFGDPKTPFSIATTQKCRGGHYSFFWIAPLTLDPYHSARWLLA